MLRRAHLLFAGLCAALVAQPARPPRGGGSGGPPPGWGGGWGNENDLGGSLVRTEGSGVIDEDQVKTAREVASHSTGTPMWDNPRGFEKDVFTFARAIFKVGPNSAPGYGRGRRLGWWVDFPDADLNLSYRLQQMTSMRTDPDGRVLKLTNPDIHNYPFLLMEHPGYMMLKEPEVAGLRKYLLAGGVLAVIDFWNSTEWAGFAAQMKKVLPEREWTELTFDHPLFHCVFDLKGPMQSIQVPTMQFWNRNHDPKNPDSPIQIDRGEGSQKVSVRTLNDDKGRIMAIAFHNTDITDGWEREGEQPDYFAVFSERVSYPIGVNLIFYLMTH
ncbi:MAG: DUF4159 domain-containing protein [Opitutaceae bacterium]|nr:DUF4159 domain-containing protein [Opitutaceae bacterium]